MKGGCFGRIVYLSLLVVAFGASSYLWFTIFVRGKSVATPNLIGRDIARARALSSDRGIELLVDESRDRHSDRVPTGNVVWQNRAPGALIKRGSRLFVGRSLGPLILAVPSLGGQSQRTALLRFSQRNLKLGNVSYTPSQSSGIIATDPPEGTVVPAQTSVSLLVSYPATPPTWVMPDLIDRSLDSVRGALEGRGLPVSNVKFEPYPGLPEGIIIRQYPLPGSPVSMREPIALVVVRNDAAVFDEEVPLQ